MTGVVAPTSQVLLWQHGGGVRQHVAPPVPSVPGSARLCSVPSTLLWKGGAVAPQYTVGVVVPRPPPPEDPQIHGCASSALRPPCPQIRRLQMQRASYTLPFTSLVPEVIGFC